MRKRILISAEFGKRRRLTPRINGDRLVGVPGAKVDMGGRELPSAIVKNNVIFNCV